MKFEKSEIKKVLVFGFILLVINIFLNEIFLILNLSDTNVPFWNSALRCFKYSIIQTVLLVAVSMLFALFSVKKDFKYYVGPIIQFVIFSAFFINHLETIDTENVFILWDNNNLRYVDIFSTEASYLLDNYMEAPIVFDGGVYIAYKPQIFFLLYVFLPPLFMSLLVFTTLHIAQRIDKIKRLI